MHNPEPLYVSRVMAEAPCVQVHAPVLPNASPVSPVEYSHLKQPQDDENDGNNDYDGEKDDEPADAFRPSLFLVVTVEP